MNNQPNQPQPSLSIKAKDEILEGKYANMAQVGHTKEEFILDFINVYPPHGILNARMIMSPGHTKRLLRAIQDNIQKYEARFGAIAEAEEPKTQFGFPVK